MTFFLGPCIGLSERAGGRGERFNARSSMERDRKSFIAFLLVVAADIGLPRTLLQTFGHVESRTNNNNNNKKNNKKFSTVWIPVMQLFSYLPLKFRVGLHIGSGSGRRNR